MQQQREGFDQGIGHEAWTLPAKPTLVVAPCLRGTIARRRCWWPEAPAVADQFRWLPEEISIGNPQSLSAHHAAQPQTSHIAITH
jgi:hypothetical protein